MDKAGEVLHEAAVVLGERGWIQGKFSSDEGYCAMGAIHVAASRCFVTADYSASEAINRFAEYLGHTKGLHAISIAPWNDRPQRTAEDVILALKHAAAWEK